MHETAGTNLKTQLHLNNINWIFGLIFLTFGTSLIIHSISDFFKYNFTSVLFVIMRSNSSIISEFIFGVLLFISGTQIFSNKKSWLRTIKILTLVVIINLTFGSSLKFFGNLFDWLFLLEMLVTVAICFGVYRLTNYLIRVNNSQWNIKREKANLIFSTILAFFPFLFRNVFFN